MGRLGLGFPAGRRRVQLAAKKTPQSITPSANWDGTSGSGFVELPVDPVRTTAKPVLRELFVPKQRYTDQILVGVIAAANNNGSLLDNLGLEKVICHFEGNTIDITEPSIQRITDANGVTREYIGWWATLEHNGTSGRANVYFEAIAKDATMQSRTIGPFTMHPASQIHDFELEVAKTPIEIDGQRYKTVKAAWEYLMTQAADTALVTITEPGDYHLDVPKFGWNRGPDAGWIVVTATAAVRFMSDLNANGLPDKIRPKIEPICYRGSNITFDFFQSSEYNFEPSWGLKNWLDGVQLTNSNGREDLARKRPRNLLSHLIRDKQYLTECSFTNLWANASFQGLVRGCNFSNCWGDLFNNSDCVVDCVINEFDSNWYRSPVPALNVQYQGAATTATIRATGNTTTKTWTLAEDGIDVASFQTLSGEADFLIGTNYSVRNVADWINAQSGWAATLIDDSRAAYGLGLDTGIPGTGFAALDAKSTELTFYTRFDIHADVYQLQNGASAKENVAIWGLTGWQLVAQDIFLTGTPGLNDAVVVNCAFHNKPGEVLISQLDSVHSHVVLAHNSLASQTLGLRTNLLYNPDNYCLVANNTAQALNWTGAPNADLTILNNHLQDGASAPAGSTGTTIGGNTQNLFVDAAVGDFGPTGELGTSRSTPAIKHDRNQKKRGPTAPAGSDR